MIPSKEDILNKRSLIYYMGSGDDEVEGSKQDVLDSMDEWASQQFNEGVEACIEVVKKHYESTVFGYPAKEQEYLNRAIDSMIEKLEQLKK